MIDHVILTISDLDRSKAFYERALAPLRVTATPEFPWGSTQARGVGFGGEDKVFFVVEGSPIQSPIHLAFRGATRAGGDGVPQRGSGRRRQGQRRASAQP